MSKGSEFARWPTALAGTALAGAALGIDIATQAPVAAGVWALAAACFGAFLYAEGARHREWWARNGTDEGRTPDVPSEDDLDVRGPTV